MISQIADHLVGVLTSAAALLGVMVAWRKVSQAQAETDLALREMGLQAEGLSFSAFLQDWDQTMAELTRLMEETEIDRVAFFRAWNGKLSPKWTTAVLQIRDAGQQLRQYVHFPLDDDYVDRLRRTVRDGSMAFGVSTAPESAIKAVYEAEGVKSSYWAHISSTSTDDKGSVSVSYMSFSSHSAEELSPSTQTRCMIIAGRLKGIAANFADRGGA